MYILSPFFHSHESNNTILSYHSHVISKIDDLDHDHKSENKLLESSVEYLSIQEINIEVIYTVPLFLKYDIVNENRISEHISNDFAKKIFLEQVFDPLQNQSFLFFSDSSPPLV